MDLLQDGLGVATFPWPSLYNPNKELGHIAHHDPVQPGAHYLYDAHDIFLYTLYWSLIFSVPAYCLCGLYGFLNFCFPPPRQRSDDEPESRTVSIYSLRRFSYHEAALARQTSRPQLLRKTNERRSRLTFAVIVFLMFVGAGVLGAVLSSAIVGYVLAGLYKAAKFNMSTWIPFLWALILTLVGFLGSWHSVIDII